MYEFLYIIIIYRNNRMIQTISQRRVRAGRRKRDGMYNAHNIMFEYYYVQT